MLLEIAFSALKENFVEALYRLVDLTHIFPHRGEAPGIASTTGTKGWGQPGQQRANTSHDGTTTSETLLEVEPNHYFAYCVEHFTSPVL